jgi:hypothetical protein
MINAFAVRTPNCGDGNRAGDCREIDRSAIVRGAADSLLAELT